jgi:hypothetical protein
MKNKGTLSALLVLVLLCNQLAAQQIRFRKVIGNDGYDQGHSAEQTFDKGYIAAGSSSSFGSSNTDMYAVKTNQNGVPQFHKLFGGINIDRGYSIKQTADSGYIFLGYTNSFGAGGYDFYLVKTDSLLNTQWEKTYGGSDWDFGYCVEQTTDGGYILCGSTYSYGAGNLDYYLIKTNASGDTTWTKTYGGSSDDEAKSVIQSIDGGYVITGYTRSMGDSLGDFYTIKTDNLGDTTWTRKFGGLQADFSNDVLECISGDFIVGGGTESMGAGNSDGVIVKYTPAGSYVADYTIGNTLYDNINSICEGSDGKINMVGRTDNFGGLNGDIYSFIIRSNWSYYFATTFGSLDTDIGYSVEATADTSFIICGSTNGFNNGLDDIYLIKTDTVGYAGGAGTDTYFVTNIREASDQVKAFSFFPNPANDLLHFNFFMNTGEPSTLNIYDLLGKTIRTYKLSSEAPFSIDLSEFAEGAYTVTLRSAGQSSSQKLIVIH